MMKIGGQFMRQQMNVFYAGNNGRSRFHQLQRPIHRRANAINPDVESASAKPISCSGFRTILGAA